MQVAKKDLPKSQAEIVIELSIAELTPYLVKAAEEISKDKKIPGFRPGKAPLEIVIKNAGEMVVYQTAAGIAIEATVYQAIDEQKIEIVDQPKIEVQKLAPGNPFIYKATVALVPKIKICDFEKIKVKPIAETKIEEKQIEKVLNDIQKMRAKEVLEDKTAEKGNRVELDFDTFMDNVPIDGGQAKKHKLTIGDGQMIPGFEENIIGLKSGQEKEFELSFPKEYHEKKLAGKKAEFKIKLQAVYKVELPEINDDFAKGFGLPSLEGLRKNISSNIEQEQQQKEKQRLELEIIEQLIEKSEFEEIPEVLIDQETHKMVHELEDNIARQGMKFDDYLSHLKKTEADLRLDFAVDAIKRVKTGLIIRQIAKQENIQATEKEIDDETERTLATYKMNPAYADQLNKLEENLRSEHAKQYFGNVIANRKTMELLKEKSIKN